MKSIREQRGTGKSFSKMSMSNMRRNRVIPLPLSVTTQWLFHPASAPQPQPLAPRPASRNYVEDHLNGCDLQSFMTDIKLLNSSSESKSLFLTGTLKYPRSEKVILKISRMTTPF
jgi:hypothetical protein